MKNFATALVLLALCSAAQATTLEHTACTASAVCINPAAGVEYISVNSQYGRVLASVNGVLYDSGLYAVHIDVIIGTYPVQAILFGPNGQTLSLDATFKHWTTRVVSGRGAGYIQHYELVDGTID